MSDSRTPPPDPSAQPSRFAPPVVDQFLDELPLRDLHRLRRLGLHAPQHIDAIVQRRLALHPHPRGWPVDHAGAAEMIEPTYADFFAPDEPRGPDRAE